MMNNTTISAIDQNKLIVIVRGIPQEYLLNMAEAMLKGGIRLMEITFDAKNREDNQQTAQSIHLLKEKFGGELHIGAGTVLDITQLQMAEQAGAEYIISPDTNEEVIRATKQLGLVSIPGALTPTEIQKAHIAGADYVKLFPVDMLGAEYVRAVKAPLSHIKMMAVGGISLENIKNYRGTGICGFGVGGALANKKRIMEGRFDEIEELSRRFVAEVESCCK